MVFFTANSLNNLGEVSRAQGKHLEAKRFYQESLAIRREIGDRMGMAVSLNNLGGVAYRLGEYEEADRLLRESLAIFTELRTRREQAYPLSILGRVARDLGNHRESLIYYQKALGLCMEVRNTPKALDVLAEIASLQALAGEGERAVALLALVLHHSASSQEIRGQAERALAKLEADLPPGAMAAAQERGRRRELKEVVEEVLGEKTPADHRPHCGGNC